MKSKTFLNYIDASMFLHEKGSGAYMLDTINGFEVFYRA